MTKSKTTKRALLSSCVALMLCFSMLLGTTYAWFTDTASTGVNMIQSGTLDVALEDNAGNSLEGKSLAFKEAGANPDGEILWEPGVTFVTDGFMVVNKGNLALKYKVVINGISDGSTAKLLEAIDFYVTTEDPSGYSTVADYEAAINGKTIDLYTFVSTYNYLAPKGESEKILGVDCDDASEEYFLVGHMKEEAGNEYQGLTLEGLGITVYATQVEAEFDSFDNTYDEDAVPDYEEPIAYIKPLLGDELNVSATNGIGGAAESLSLDVGYKFNATETLEEAEESPYEWWHADFVVYADREVPGDSITLAGYYSAFCDLLNNGNWVALSTSNDIPANTEIRLVQPLGNVAYREICDYGYNSNGFQCGAVALNPQAVAGTTLSVELRLYEVENADSDSGSHNVEVTPENYITIGKYEYTFPAAEVADTDGLKAALAAGASHVKLAAGNYTFPASSLKAGTTLECEEGTVFEGNSKLNIDGATVIGATFSNPSGTAVDQTINGTFKDCTFTGSNGLRWCYAGETVVFENCVFDGSTYGAHFDGGANDVIFKNCTFSGFNAMGGAITKLTMEGCTFKANGKSGYNGINLWGNTEMTNCTFVFDGGASYEWVDMCGDNTTGTFTDCVISDGTTERALTTADVGDYGTGNTITVQ